MERIFTNQDVDPGALKGATIAVIGYGSQGRAHARNLRDSGFDVVVGARAGGGAERRAKADGFRTVSPAEAAKEAQLVALLTPDMQHRTVYADDIAPNLAPGDALLVVHVGTHPAQAVLVPALLGRARDGRDVVIAGDHGDERGSDRPRRAEDDDLQARSPARRARK